MSQREKLKSLIIHFCNERDSRTFSLKDLHTAFGDYNCIGVGGNTPQATVRRLLQELRHTNFLSFVDMSGCYTVRELELLDSEREALKNIDISRETPIKREYLLETYVRKTKLVKLAIRTLGYNCMLKNCDNSFITNNGIPYIEVHHIIPLCRGGEDAIWNLSVLCAHHHKMAHFARNDMVIEIEKYLLKEVQYRI